MLGGTIQSAAGSQTAMTLCPCHGCGNRRKITPFGFSEWIAMVVIRLSRGGASKRPFFKVVVADSRRSRDGKFIERIGFYDPMAPQGHESLRIQMDRINHWQGRGAKLSDTVVRLIKQLGAQKAA